MQATCEPPADPAAMELLADGALTLARAAKFSGVCRNVLYDLMNAGELPWLQPGKNRLIPRKALVAWLAKHPIHRGRKP